MSQRLTVMVEDDIAEMLIELAGSSRKQGEYLSGLIRGIYESELDATPAADFEQMRLTMTGMTSKLMQVEARLLSAERQLSAIKAN